MEKEGEIKSCAGDRANRHPETFDKWKKGETRKPLRKAFDQGFNPFSKEPGGWQFCPAPSRKGCRI